jgi:hypothetical protein
MKNITNKQIKPDLKKKKKRNIFSLISSQNSSVDMSKFDPITGEKIANQIMQPQRPVAQQQPVNDRNEIMKREALMEIKADAIKGKKKPVDLWETAKNGTLGSTAGVVLGNLTNASNRTKGIISLGLGGIIAANDIRKQIADYNNQMAAREALSGNNTQRKKAYIESLKQKYRIK